MWVGPRVVSVARVRKISRAWAWIQSHPAAADAALAAALLGAAIWSSHVYTDLFSGDPKLQAPDATENIVGLAAVVLPLALRRRAPLTVLVASTAAYIAYVVLLGPVVEGSITVIAVALAVYSAATHGRARRRDWACGICLVAIVGLIVFNNPFGYPLEYQLLQVLVYVALFCALWSLGAALNSRRRRAEELLERTVELEREREENARRAVFDERVRIARELHDVVAHHVSMMGVQAGAARIVLGRDPVKAQQALASIEGSSRQAVVELHRLLGFLRQEGDPDDLGSQPGLGQLDGLAASISDSQLAIEVRVEGERRLVAATIDVSAYRIVQEALTNVVKHAGASRADVHVRYWPDELELEIVDDGRGNGASSSAPGGLGLIGMRERAVLHGGQLTAGRVAGGGFAVRVRLPTPAGAL
jgi:signal transduction histidine kinase